MSPKIKIGTHYQVIGEDQIYVVTEIARESTVSAWVSDGQIHSVTNNAGLLEDMIKQGRYKIVKTELKFYSRKVLPK